MRRGVSIAIVGVWLMLLAVLVFRTWPPSVPAPDTVVRIAPRVGEEWMGVYYHQQKVGYTRQRVTAEAGGFVFSEEALLRLTALQTPQTVQTRLHGHAGPDLALRDVNFELSSGVGHLHVAALVTAAGLRLTVRSGADLSEQLLPLREPVYVPATLRAALRTKGLRAGLELETVVFDPVTMTNDRIRVTVGDQEAVPHAVRGERGWRVHEEFRGLTTTAWIDATGAVFREEGPMGMVLVRQTADEALNQDWATDTALDLVAQAAVPVTQPISEPRQRRILRVRVSGISTEDIPTDEEQRRDGSVVAITRPELNELPSYLLPYEGTALAADVAPTAFLQSAHPHVLGVAREIVGDERDAKRAALRLNDWVYEHIRKVPTISIPNALQVLEMGQGDCNEHAVLLAALGRAVGLPTRLVAGAVYLDGAFFYHAWCDVWVGRWVSIDPALHQFPADATHIKLVVGDPDAQLRMLGIIGRLGVEVLNDHVTAEHGTER
jgi:hypothetical protein